LQNKNSLTAELSSLKEELSVVETDAASKKLSLNGCYGKLGSKWSFLFSPDLMIHTTLTGQLSLLMLIEWMEDAGIKVYSANTDGIVLLYPKELEAKKTELISLWERVTNFETEGTFYRAVYSRDVNNYIAIKTDGKVKTKGAYALGGLMKNPKNNICTEAVIEYLTHNKPIEETIFNCRDIRKFLTVRKVEGGAIKWEKYLGRVVRWYYASGETGQINYAKNGNKVPESNGGKPLMELSESFPEDVDYARYVAEARSILAEIGAL